VGVNLWVPFSEKKGLETNEGVQTHHISIDPKPNQEKERRKKGKKGEGSNPEGLPCQEEKL